MTIRYKCPECGAALNINDELAGTEGNCPRCQSQFVVPAPESEPVSHAESAPKAEAVAQPAAEGERPARTQAAGALLSEDDIGDFLNSEPSPSSSGGRGSGPDSDDELPTEKANPFDEESDEAETARRSRAQKSKRGAAAKKPESAGKSASIAQSLMGRGAPVPDEPEEPGKKKRKQFGGREERHPGELTSYKEVITYFAKLGWPYVLGIGLFVGFLIYLVYSRWARIDTPPLVQVVGTVTIDGKPLKRAIVKFVPQFEGPEGYKNGTASFGFTDENGKYTLQYASDDGKPILGAVIAKHQVQIQLNDLGGGQVVPPRYSSSLSDLNVEVKKGIGPQDFALKSDPVEKTE